MAALSDYLESGLLHHVFRGEIFNRPSGIAIALCSGVPKDSDTGVNQQKGGDLPELPSGDGTNSSGYSREFLGDPTAAATTDTPGKDAWSYSTEDNTAGSGIIKNARQITFDTALYDWGYVSGIAIIDSGEYGVGNLLMHAALDNPRVIYKGDSVKFDMSSLQISFK
jgi:hypothetical protein